MTLPFGEWLPDLAAKGNPGATEAKNVIPSVDGYVQFQSLLQQSTALNTACLGAVSLKSSAGVSYNYAGTGTKLYELSSQTWTDTTRVAGDYVIDAGDFWEFVPWGTKLIAVGGHNADAVPQIITLGAANFADLSGSPPRAKHVTVVRNFVAMGNLYESAASYPYRIRWSGINDETTWTTDVAKQADYQDLFSVGGGSDIQAIRGGEYGVIWQGSSIWRMDYQGPPAVFSMNETLPGYGTPAPNSVVQWGDVCFYLDQAGFKTVTQGAQIGHIGQNKIDNWFYNHVDSDNLAYVIGALDRFNQRVFWIFPSNGTTPDMGVVFDTRSGRWAHFDLDAEWIYNALGSATDVEGLDAISASIDALSESLDSRTWMGGAIQLNGFDTAHKSGSFTGDALAATLETSEGQIINNRRALVSRARPEIDGASTVTIAAGTRQDMSDSVSWGAAASAERDGSHALRDEGRYHRFRAVVTGGFGKAQGVAVEEASDSGAY